MKKNLLSVIILTLLIVNIVLNVITMMSVTGTNKKTAEVIDKIATAIDMDLAADATEDSAPAVSMEDTVVYDITDSMTIPLKKGADGKDHYCMIAVSFSMNSKHDDYKTFGETISTKESLIKSEVIDVIGGHTLEELQADTETIKSEVLKRVQNMFGSDFIYKVAFSDVKYQ